MFNWLGLIQILIIVVALWLFYRSFIRNTASEKLVRGLFGLAALWGASFVLNWIGLDLLGGFLHWMALFLSLGLVVIFQPELRKFMALMGDTNQWRRILYPDRSPTRNTRDLDAITSAVEYMSARHTGALIVFAGTLDEGAIERKGTPIDAQISSEL